MVACRIGASSSMRRQAELLRQCQRTADRPRPPLIGCDRGPVSRIAGVEFDPQACRPVPFEAAGLKAESGLVVLKKNTSAGDGVEFDAPAAFRMGSASKRAAARVGANLLEIFPSSQTNVPRPRSSLEPLSRWFGGFAGARAASGCAPGFREPSRPPARWLASWPCRASIPGANPCTGQGQDRKRSVTRIGKHAEG